MSTKMFRVIIGIKKLKIPFHHHQYIFQGPQISNRGAKVQIWGDWNYKIVNLTFNVISVTFYPYTVTFLMETDTWEQQAKCSMYMGAINYLNRAPTRGSFPNGWSQDFMTWHWGQTVRRGLHFWGELERGRDVELLPERTKGAVRQLGSSSSATNLSHKLIDSLLVPLCRAQSCQIELGLSRESGKWRLYPTLARAQYRRADSVW